MKRKSLFFVLILAFIMSGVVACFVGCQGVTISLSKESAIMEAGDTLRLQAVTSNDSAITWSSTYFYCDC